MEIGTFYENNEHLAFGVSPAVRGYDELLVDTRQVGRLATRNTFDIAPCVDHF